MRIGIIGTGNIGSTQGRRWAARHEVAFGTRKPESAEARALLAAAGASARAASARDAAAFGDVVVLANPWAATLDTVRAAGDLTGKIVVDCTNPVGPGLRHALPGLSFGGDRGGGEGSQDREGLQRGAFSRSGRVPVARHRSRRSPSSTMNRPASTSTPSSSSTSASSSPLAGMP